MEIFFLDGQEDWALHLGVRTYGKMEKPFLNQHIFNVISI